MLKDGIPYVAVPLILSLGALWWGGWWLALPFIGLTLFMAYFFRDPNRRSPTDSDVVVAPADGKVTKVARVDSANPQSPQVVSIFLSPFDVHVNRAPITGRVTEVTHTKGQFLIATKEESSHLNEQTALTIEGERLTVVCKQIAGVVARRIVCWSKPGDQLQQGERFGFIKFSSRTDLILPSAVQISVKVGDRVRGGESVIGRLA